MPPMNRVISIALVMLIATVAMGEDLGGEKYLVATRSRPDANLTRGFHRDLAPVRTFRSVDGFAATLTDEQVATLRDHPDVLFVEKDPRRYPLELVNSDESATQLHSRHWANVVVSAEESTQETPYGVTLIRAHEVWNVTRGEGVKVGVVDTGIDPTHPDLEPNVAGGRSFLASSSWIDVGSHGTHVSGTIAGVDNGFGVVGVAPDAELYALRVFNGQGDFVNASGLIEVIDWAIENGVTILNMSLGGPDDSLLERQAFEKAAANDLFIAAASGNTGDNIRQYPAAYPGAFAVGAVDSSSNIAAFSTFGGFVDVVGPGVGVRSTIPQATSRSLNIETAIGPIEGLLLAFSPRDLLSGEWVHCGIGRVDEFPAEVQGKVALIQRGELFFADKAKNAKAAGATAVVIYNNVPGLFNGTLGDDGFDYPLTVGISQESGEALIASGNAGFESSSYQPYGLNNGTSMATPHVAGAAALLRALAPDATSVEIEDALKTTARDLGNPGFDVFYGHGLIDVGAAARQLAPERFAQTRQRPVRR